MLLLLGLRKEAFTFEDEKSVTVTHEGKLDLILAEAWASLSKLNLAKELTSRIKHNEASSVVDQNLVIRKERNKVVVVLAVDREDVYEAGVSQWL